jgi:tRNA(fMet)-specific endonuclease VapC
VERLILDTSVLVSAERHGAQAIARSIAEEDDVAIAALTLAELRVGVLLASGKRRASRSEYASLVEQTFAIEDYTATVALSHADLLVAARRAGKPRGAHDLIIAATAIATGRTLITSDQRGFADLPGLSVGAPP